LLRAGADEFCTEFAGRWGIDIGLLRANIPGLANPAGPSVPPPMKNYAWLACLGMLAFQLALFLLGIMAGLVSVGSTHSLNRSGSQIYFCVPSPWIDLGQSSDRAVRAFEQLLAPVWP
jgi:hypothetical protein